eukprot:3305134-Rhodomonas_salina.1
MGIKLRCSRPNHYQVTVLRGRRCTVTGEEDALSQVPRRISNLAIVFLDTHEEGVADLLSKKQRFLFLRRLPPGVKHVCTRIVGENLVQTCLRTPAGLHPTSANAQRFTNTRTAATAYPWVLGYNSVLRSQTT